MKLLVAATAIAIGAFLPAGANDETYASIAAGNDSCGKFLSNYRNDPAGTEHIYGQWASGFLSGSNSVCVKQAAADFFAVAAFIRKWCEDSPLKTVAQGAFVARVQLGGPSEPDQCR
jgi:hypothetical protein